MRYLALCAVSPTKHVSYTLAAECREEAIARVRNFAGPVKAISHLNGLGLPEGADWDAVRAALAAKDWSLTSEECVGEDLWRIYVQHCALLGAVRAGAWKFATGDVVRDKQGHFYDIVARTADVTSYDEHYVYTCRGASELDDAPADTWLQDRRTFEANFTQVPCETPEQLHARVAALEQELAVERAFRAQTLDGIISLFGKKGPP